jgi:hypothetical protein
VYKLVLAVDLLLLSNSKGPEAANEEAPKIDSRRLQFAKKKEKGFGQGPQGGNPMGGSLIKKNEEGALRWW